MYKFYAFIVTSNYSKNINDLVILSPLNGASSTVQINPTKNLVHPTLFRHTPSHVRTNPKFGVCTREWVQRCESSQSAANLEQLPASEQIHTTIEHACIQQAPGAHWALVGSQIAWDTCGFSDCTIIGTLRFHLAAQRGGDGWNPLKPPPVYPPLVIDI